MGMGATNIADKFSVLTGNTIKEKDKRIKQMDRSS